MHQDELRRIQRVNVCCRVDVHGRFGVWTALTEDLCARGCRLVTVKSPRVGTLLDLSLSSDLFPEALEITATVSWVSDQRVGLNFVAGEARAGSLSAKEWVDRVVEHGRVLGPGSVGSMARVAPAVRRSPSGARPGARPPPEAHRVDTEDAVVLPLPLHHG